MADLAQAATWHRQVAALAAAADRAGVGGAALGHLRSRLHAQQARFGPAGAGPPLHPSPAEISAAAAQLGDLSDASVTLAVRMAQSTLDAAEAALETQAPRLAPTGAHPGAPVSAPPGPAASAGLRNGLVYGGYALLVLVAQIALFVALDEQTLPLLAPVCLLVLPAFAWVAGWFTIGAVFRARPGKTSRTPRIGAVICLVPDLLLCAGIIGLFLLR